MGRYWHVAIARNRYSGQFACLLYKTPESMRRLNEVRAIVEYRRSRSFSEALRLVWIYNH